MSFQKMLSFLLLSFAFIVHNTIAVPNFLKLDCSNETFIIPNYGTYAKDIGTLFSSFSSITGLFAETTIPSARPVYGQYLCRGDNRIDECKKCVSNATQLLAVKCPLSISAQIWYDDCTVRYSDVKFFGTYSEPLDHIWFLECNDKTVFHETRPMEALIFTTMKNIVKQVANSENNLDKIESWSLKGDGRVKYFGTKEVNLTLNTINHPRNFTNLYTVVQCMPDLSVEDCYSCLTSLISVLSKCSMQKFGAKVASRNCFIRYETYQFYNNSTLFPSFLPSIPTPYPVTFNVESHPLGKVSLKAVVGITIPASILVGLATFGVRLFLRVRKQKRVKPLTFPIGVYDSFDTVESLQYGLEELKDATQNFSDYNKIGHGGFGCVYRGTLHSGQEIAIKKLIKKTSQVEQDFKNEVEVVAKLQHRNLVRLLGFCLTKDEKLLVFEYVPNKSLDKLLFDSQERLKLNWLIRFNIIIGIARGLLYLHEESPYKIVHRDLKPANILLDRDMNPKIADFGMARFFGIKKIEACNGATYTTHNVTSSAIDLTHLSTCKGGGTLGYMAPECAYRGQVSVKTDVYSFGVMILEIITGKINSRFHLSGLADDLLSYGWIQWSAGTPLKLIDEALLPEISCLNEDARNQVLICIHLGLLCVQKDPRARPAMPVIVQMLNFRSDNSLPQPQEPAITTLGGFRIDENDDEWIVDYSNNGFSITSEYDPR